MILLYALWVAVPTLWVAALISSPWEDIRSFLKKEEDGGID
jgi:hypothetical protein